MAEWFRKSKNWWASFVVRWYCTTKFIVLERIENTYAGRDGIVCIVDVRVKSGKSPGRTNVWWVPQGGRMLHKVTQDMENEIDYYITMWFKNGDAK